MWILFELRHTYTYICVVYEFMKKHYENVTGRLILTGNFPQKSSIGYVILIGHFPQKSPIVSGSFARHDLQLKASYGSLRVGIYECKYYEYAIYLCHLSVFIIFTYIHVQLHMYVYAIYLRMIYTCMQCICFVPTHISNIYLCIICCLYVCV